MKPSMFKFFSWCLVVKWSKSTAHIYFSGNRLAVLSNGALKFSRVTLGDGGSYQCLAQNTAGTAVGRTRLILQGAFVFNSTVDLIVAIMRLEHSSGV